MVSHNLTVIEGHWSSASEYIKYLICPVTSKNHVIEGSNNFMSGSSSWYITTLPNLVAIGIVKLEILVCHVISPDHMIKGSCDFKGRRLSGSLSILSSVVVIGTLVVEM